MAIYHNNIEICSGSKGGSAVASAAYQSATKLYSEQDREAKDYTRKENVLDSGIIKPENAPDWCLDRERLWNEVEKKEGIDGRYCRKHDLALPQELNFEQQQELVKKYCLELSKQGMVCDWAIHNNKSGTNPHCHILTTDRAFDENGNWLAKEKNVTVRDSNGKAICIGRDKKGRKRYKHTTVKTTDWDRTETLEKWRKTWADLSNQALEKAGSNERISEKSYLEQGIDKMPTEHLGYAMSYLEKRGIVTDRGKYNRSVKQINEEFAQLKAENENLSKVIKESEVLYYEQSRAKLKPNVRQTLHRSKRRQNSKLSLLSNSRAFSVYALQELSLDKKQNLQNTDNKVYAQNNLSGAEWDSLADREQSGSQQQRTEERSRTRSNRRLLTLSAHKLKRGYKRGPVTILTPAYMTAEERSAIAQMGKEILEPIKNKKDWYVTGSKNLMNNTVWARAKSGKLHLIDIDKEKAIEKGLLESKLGKPKKLGVREIGAKAKELGTGAKEAGSQLLGAGKDCLKGLASAFDENATKEDHLKQMRGNIKEIIKTPINIVKDILTNPLTAILKLPARALEAISNGIQAGAQLVAASTKNQPHQQSSAPVRKAWK